MSGSSGARRFVNKLAYNISIVGFLLIMGGPKTAFPVVYNSTQTIGVDTVGVDWYRGGIILSSDVYFGTPLPVESDSGDTGIKLNTHTITLTSDICMGSNTQIIGTGSLASDPYGDHALILNGDVSLAEGNIDIITTFTIDGGGNVLDFNSHNLTIKNPATLTFKNIVLRNVKESSIIWEGDHSRLVLDNVVVELTGNLEINTGGDLGIYGDVLIKGGQTFTQVTGTIIDVYQGATLTFGQDATLCIKGGAFSNQGSLFFDGSTVDLPGPGHLNLSAAAGSVLFDNRVVITGGQTFDNSNPGSTTKVLSGATVELKDGATLNLG